MDCSKCTTVVQGVVVGEAVPMWGVGICEISGLPTQFSCVPKTALKNLLYFSIYCYSNDHVLLWLICHLIKLDIVDYSIY